MNILRNKPWRAKTPILPHKLLTSSYFAWVHASYYAADDCTHSWYPNTAQPMHNSIKKFSDKKQEQNRNVYSQGSVVFVVSENFPHFTHCFSFWNTLTLIKKKKKQLTLIYIILHSLFVRMCDLVETAVGAESGGQVSQILLESESEFQDVGAQQQFSQRFRQWRERKGQQV